MNNGQLIRLDLDLVDTIAALPATYTRLARLHHELWTTSSGDGDVPVQTSGHGDPTGDTVAASLAHRRHLDTAYQLLTSIAQSARGAACALDKAEGTIAGYDGTQAAADQAVAHTTRSRCQVCHDHAATRKGRCGTCHQWWLRHGTERPKDQHQRQAH